MSAQFSRLPCMACRMQTITKQADRTGRLGKNMISHRHPSHALAVFGAWPRHCTAPDADVRRRRRLESRASADELIETCWANMVSLHPGLVRPRATAMRSRDARRMISAVQADKAGKVTPIRDTSGQDRPLDPEVAHARRKKVLIAAVAGGALLLLATIVMVRSWIAGDRRPRCYARAS